MDTPDTASPDTRAPCTDGSQLRWSPDAVVVERPGGDAVTFAASETTLQLSRAELPGRPSALERLLRLTPPTAPHLVVELRSGTRRCALRARATPEAVAELPRLDSAGDHELALDALESMVAALRAGGANVARGHTAPVTPSTDVGLDYAGRGAWRGVVNASVGGALIAAGLVVLARGVGDVWGVALAAAGFVVSLVVYGHHRARSRIAAGHRESPPRSTTTWVALAALGAAACGVATIVQAVLASEAVAGALVIAGLMPLWIGLVQAGHRRVFWSRARLDTHGLHGWRPGRPGEEHIGWEDLARLRERAVNEGAQRLDRTSLMADALYLGSLPAAARPGALRVAAGESLETRRARLPDVRDWLAWQPSPPRTVQVFTITMLVLGAIIVPAFVLPFGLAWEDARVWALAGVAAVLSWMIARTHVTRGVDRGQRLWLQVTRRLRSPHRGAGSPYLVGERDVLVARAIEGFELRNKPNTGLTLATRGAVPVDIEHLSDEAAGRARLETLERFLAGGAAPTDANDRPLNPTETS